MIENKQVLYQIIIFQILANENFDFSKNDVVKAFDLMLDTNYKHLYTANRINKNISVLYNWI